MFAPETLRFARPVTLPCKVYALEAVWFLLTCAFALLYEPMFRYTDTGTAFLLGIGMYAVAAYMFACLVAVAAFIPARRLGGRSLVAIASFTALLNPYVAGNLDLGGSFLIPYLIGIVPFGFPFGVVAVWAIMAAIRAACLRDRKAIAYGAVPLVIAGAYFAGIPLAARLAVVTIPRIVRPAILLPNTQPQIVAYELDGGDVVYDSQRYVVRDDAHIGIARAAELVRRSSGAACRTGEPREIYRWWYDVYVDCMG
jgi:hypothetical protein